MRSYLAKSLHGGNQSTGRRQGRRRAADPRRRAVFETLEPRLLMATVASPDSALPITVTNVNDSGPGSLRQAILDANGTPGPTHTINFAIPAGSQTINLLSSLPRATTVPDVMVLDATQNVTVVSPSASDQDNFGALIKTGAGTLTISGANNLVGNIEVDGSSLRISDSIAPTLAAGIVANVQGTGTLELAGSVSALAGGANGVNVTNNSAASAGLLVSEPQSGRRRN